MASWQENALPASCQIYKTSPDLAHVTIFLVHVTDDGIPEMQREIEKALEGFGSFGITIDGVKNFGEHVLYGAVQGNERLEKLYKVLKETANSSFFFEDLADRHGYTPHLTLAKHSGGKFQKEDMDIIDETLDTFFGKELIDSVQLLEMDKYDSEGYYKEVFKVVL